MSGPQQAGCAIGEIDDDIAMIGVNAFGDVENSGRMAANRVTRVGGYATNTASCQPPGQCWQGLCSRLSQTYIVHLTPRGSSEKSPWSLPAPRTCFSVIGEITVQKMIND
jgi:hypothetical protein